MKPQLSAVHRAARQVIGDNLARHDLGHETLGLLRASIRRQIADAEALRDRLSDKPGMATLLLDLGGLLDFFDESLREIDRQLPEAAHRH